MKIFNLLFIIVFVFISCKKQSELSKKFDCKTNTLHHTSSISDFNKNFKLNIPTNWKTNLYYNKFQSEISTADTTKQLTNSYILNTSFNIGNLQFNSAYFSQNDSILKNHNLQLIDSGELLFQSKPSYWYLVKGEKKGFPYHQFNLTVLLTKNTYLNSYTEIYGDKEIYKRICESISIIENIKFSH